MEPIPGDDPALRALRLLRRVVVPVLAVLLGVAAVSVGTGVRDATGEHAGAVRSVPATLLQPAGRMSAIGSVTVAAVWPVPRGGTRVGPIVAPAGRDVGQDVSLWVDADGTPVRPAAPAAADGAGLTAGATVVGVGGLVLVVLSVGAACADRRLRSRRTDREWSAVEPVWSGRR